MSIFGVILARIFPHSYPVRIRENADKNNSENEHFLRSVTSCIPSFSFQIILLFTSNSYSKAPKVSIYLFGSRMMGETSSHKQLGTGGSGERNYYLNFKVRRVAVLKKNILCMDGL